MKKKNILVLAVALLSNLALADDYHAGNIHVDHAHARPTVTGQSSGAAYISIENKGGSADKLLTVSSPVAKSAEVHSMVMDGNIMRMREVSQLDLAPAARVEMNAGDGYHIMLVGLKKALVPGEKVPLTLRFEKAGMLDIEAIVDSK